MPVPGVRSRTSGGLFVFGAQDMASCYRPYCSINALSRDLDVIVVYRLMFADKLTQRVSYANDHNPVRRSMVRQSLYGVSH